jgi:ribosomal protein S30
VNEHLRSVIIFSASQNIVRVIKSGRLRSEGSVTRMGKVRNAFSIVVGKAERKRQLGRPRRRWDGNIKIDLRKKCGRVWTGFIWLRIGTSSGML